MKKIIIALLITVLVGAMNLSIGYVRVKASTTSNNTNMNDKSTQNKITLTKQATKIVVNDTYKFTAVTKNSKYDITWGVSNKKIATINSTGKLTAKKAGTVKVTATAGVDSVSISVKVLESTPEKNFKYSIKDDKVSIEALTNSELETVVIPARIKGKPVTTLSRGAISSMNFNGDIYLKVKTVVVPGSVKNVEMSSFYTCPNLTTIEFLEGASGICKYIIDVNVPVKNLIIPGSQKKVYHTGALNLENVSLGEGITRIEVGAFFDNTKLRHVNLPSSLQYIGKNAFHNTGFTELELYGNNLTIDKNAFSNCKKLMKVVIKNGINELPVGIFSYCTNLEELVIADTVKKIDGNITMFANLNKITMNYVADRDISPFAFQETSYKCLAAGAILNNNYEILSLTDKEFSKELKVVYDAMMATTSEVKRVKIAHDWLIRYVEYDKEAWEEPTGTATRKWEGDMEYASSYYGAIKSKMLTCNGYADMMDVLLGMVGIETERTGSVDHAWNLVKVNGKWYHLDATWDDMGGEQIRYDYFLVSDAKMSSVHGEIMTDNFGKPLPVCNDTITVYE